MKSERIRPLLFLSIVALALTVGACHQSEEETDGIKNAAEASGDDHHGRTIDRS